MSERAARRGLLALLVLFLALGTAYSVVTPLYEAPDELYHYPFVARLAGGHGLPVQDPADPGPWRQEGSQPPLYYALAALVSRWVPADPGPLLPTYPHASVGVARPDGHANMVLHTPEEGFPYRGTVLAIHLVRGLSVLLGAVTVLCTYALGMEVNPGRPGLALSAAAVVAFTPMFLFISGSVNNDNLVTALATATLWLVVRSLRRPPALGRWALMGLLLGLGALTKVSGLGLFLPVGVALGWVAWRRRDWRVLVGGGVCVVGVAVLVAGWWYHRNWCLYGDPLGWNAFLAIVGQRPYRATWRQLWGELPGLYKSYWGVFGWVNVIAPALFYRFCAALSVAGLGGLLLLAVRCWPVRRRLPADGLVGLGVLALWPLAVGAGLVRWTALTPASQGRLLFPAIGAISYLLVLGLSGLSLSLRGGRSRRSNPRFAGWGLLRSARNDGRERGWGLLRSARNDRPGRGRYVLPAVAAALLAGWSVWLPFGVIAPAYARPPLLTPAQIAAIPHRLDLTFGDRMELLGYDIDAERAEPGDDLHLTLYWRARAPMDEDYTVFVHLLDGNDLQVAQRDVYPGGGTFQTTLWQPGQAIADRHTVQLPPNAFNPSRLRVVVGLCQGANGAKVPARDGGGREVGDSVLLTEVLVQAEPQDGIANPVRFDLAGQAALIGYDIDRTALPAGEALHVTLWWEAVARLGPEHAAFVRVFDAAGRAWTGTGGQPADAPPPAAGWAPGRRVQEERTVVLPPDTPPGIYYLEAGLYRADAHTYLPRLDRWGRVQDEPCVLTRFRVLPRAEAAEASFTFPEIQHPLEAILGGRVRLRGCRLDQEAVNPHEPLRLTLYWEALAADPLAGEHTVFTHLLSPDGRVIAQHDGPPACGDWPTTNWAEGQAIVDPHHLAFGEVGYTGEAVLEVGLYNPVTMERVRTADGGDRILLPVKVEVVP